ncbi:MAG TPA: hypothetical protein PKE12_02015 [Kiritimatiellia bacterium]|nr:hypothetical protein [Kiritimatiellia bacterium]
MDAQEFRTTPARELASNPQRFWARGVVFRDVMTEIPSESRRSVGTRTAYRFLAKEVGECYAEEKIAPVLRALEPGREYIFMATVYSEQRGFIRKKTHYMILVEGVTVPAANLGALKDDVAAAIERRAADDPYAQRLNVLRALILNVQEALTSVSATEQLDRAAIFDPQSEHFDKLLSAARRAVGDLETESKIPGREHLVQILAALVALQEGALVAPVLPEEPPAELPAEPQSEAIESTPPAMNEAAVEARPVVEAEPPKKTSRSRTKKEEAKPAPEPEPEVAPTLRWQLPLAETEPVSVLDASDEKLPVPESAPETEPIPAAVTEDLPPETVEEQMDEVSPEPESESEPDTEAGHDVDLPAM